ncbi:MAG: calcium-binding protein [Xenococcaceae cyanobacterium]
MAYDNINLAILNDSLDNLFAGTSGEDIIIGGNGNDTLGGRADKDVIIGLGGNNQLFGDGGDDLLSGGSLRLIDEGNRIEITTLNKTGIDSLTGGGGDDIFVLGGNPNTLLGENTPQIDFYTQAGNDDYAVITDFNTDNDTIVLGSSRENYTIGNSPDGLPTGAGIFRGNELIAIAENVELDLGRDYFRFET